MTLNEYLVRNNLKDAEFAARIGCDRTTVFRLRRGQRPSPKLLKAIVQETGGLVDQADLYPIDAAA